MKKRISGAITATVIVAAAAIGYFEFKAVDTAGAPVSERQAVELKAAGAELFVQALTWWPRCSEPTTKPSTRVASLRNARAAGLETAGYLLLDSQTSGRDAVDRAREGLPDDVWDALSFVAVDFEIPGECFAAGIRIPYQTIADAAARVRELGKCVVVRDRCMTIIYTSYGEWTSRLVPPNPPHPPDTLLWEASWDGDPDVDFEQRPFGGWTAADVVLEQYNGGTNIAGVYVDLNSMDRHGVLSRSCDGPVDESWGGVWNPCLAWWDGPDGWNYVPVADDWVDDFGVSQYCCEEAYGGVYNRRLLQWEWRPATFWIWVAEDPVWRCESGCP